MSDFVENKLTIDAKEISDCCGVGMSKAYSIIRKLNAELSERGYITFSGKVSRVFFFERMYGGAKSD